MSLQERSSELNYAEPGASISATSSASDEEFQVLPLGYSIDNPHPGELDIHKELANLNNTTATLINSPHSKVVGCDLHIVVGDHANVYLGDCNHSKPNPDNPLPFTNVGPHRNSDSISIVPNGQPQPGKQKPRISSAMLLLPLIFLIVLALLAVAAILGWRSRSKDVDNPTTDGSTTTDVHYPLYVPREGWNALNPKNPPVRIEPALLLVGKHTGGTTCTTCLECIERVQQIQREHMEVQGFPDISYNFLIGGDGRIYIGRGWAVQNEGRNDSVDVAFIGDFNIDIPTNELISLVRRLESGGPSELGLNYGHYWAVNHNQTEPTDSPGEHLFSRLATSGFLHYSDAICYRNASSDVPRLSCVNGGPSDRQRRSNSAIVKQTTPIHRSKAELMPMIFIGSILITIIGVVVWSETKATNKSFPTASPITPYSPYTTDTPDYDGFYIPRYLWGAMDPKSSPIEARPALLMVIKHTAGKTCSDQTQCRARVRDIQKVHVLTQNYSDITYNFLIGGDGKIYNGRGWGVRNEDRNDSLDVAFIGNFNYNDPTTTMMNAASRIQIDAQLRGWVDYENYRVLNHNQTEPTDSPGSLLFSKVSLLSHYSPALCYHNSTEQVVIDYDCPYNN